MPDYKVAQVEEKWRKYWSENDTYRTEIEPNRPKYYVLDMFPYPSGAGLHVGHPLGYFASDIFARYKRMQGYNVLHPMGFDAFGLPAEQYALQTGIHPRVSTEKNIARYREQMSLLGFSFDWDRMVKTCDPNYYKWTQWIFTQLFEHYYDRKEGKAKPVRELVERFENEGNKQVEAFTDFKNVFNAHEWKAYNRKKKSTILMEYRLAYLKIGYVNWCEALGTVLANDQIKDGVSERGGYPVEKKAMTQWYLRITAYAERLTDGLEAIEWSESLKNIQNNWIGRSEGALVHFEIKDFEQSLHIYTTRPDTIFGTTFMVLAPEHPFVEEITTKEQKEEISNYIEYVKSRSEIDRMAEVKKVTGAFTGAFAINPFTKKEIPIYIAEYVLMDYGTGAIMAVPADDERDNKFAKKFGLDIVEVIDRSAYPEATMEDKVGKLMNSGFLNGMEIPEAIAAANSKIEEMGIGHKEVNYKMRDANFSRQRYWGEPFPVLFDEQNIPQMLPPEDLPLRLPDTDDFQPGKEGKSPLSRIKTWVEEVDGYHRETDTMPAVAGSSWYYLRYMDPGNSDAFASQEAVNYWQDVDLYIGGAEHAVAHLLYARFWHKFLFDIGLVPTREPFKRLINQGMIQGVTESVFLKKNKSGDQNIFYSADMVEFDDDHYARMPVPVQFVKDYGSEESYLDLEGLQKYTDWSSDFKNAKFVTKSGVFQNGSFDGEGECRMVTYSEVGKMSKSLYNVINPDDIVAYYGADCFRMYEMFLGPLENSKPWDTQGIDGVFKFIRKLWSLFHNKQEKFYLSDEMPTREELKVLHQTIQRVTDDIERYSFNTCVSHFMVCVNELKRLKCNKKDILAPLCRLLAPFAPHLSEELWEMMGFSPSIHHTSFPEAIEKYLKEDSLTYPICINGKKRSTLEVDASANNQEVEKLALEDDTVQRWLEGKTIRKVIIVPKRMINIVV